MVVGGCVLAPQESYGDFALKRYRARSILWILLTAATIVGYTMLDKIGAETVRPGLASAVIYCGLFHIMSCLSYLTIHALFATQKERAGEVGWGLPAIGAVLGFSGYALVLWAFQMAPQTSYLLAFRQFSILIGVALAFRIYRERGLAVRLPAAVAIVAGLVVVALYG